nr:pectinesterase family protein [Mesobacillus maritimus]
MVVDSSYTGEEGAVSAEQPGVQQFSTVQAAVNAVPSDNQERVVILVKAGTYVEHLRVTSPFISLIGEDRDLVNIQFYDPVLSPEGGDTALRNAVYIMKSATGFSAENLTIENTYEYLGDGTKSNESADALRVDADLSTFVNVKLVGYQDTLYASSNRQYYYKSYIVGNVDFIYGAAQALIDDSDVVFRYNATKNSGYVTAPKTDADKKYGFIFNNSRITAEDGASGSKYLLARPWGPDGGATFINTYMSGIINKDTPYNDMSGNLAENARFYEYYTYGEGFSIHSGRPQISKSQAEEMLTTSFLGWDPYTTIKDLSTFYVGDILAETPEEETPAEETPVETPAEETPAEEVPVETPGEETPVEEVPVETPGEETPVEEVPVETPGEETPVEETPVETPGEETPVEETPVETPGEETPAEETPVETPAEETPAKQEQSVVVAVAEVTKGKATISDRDVAKVTTNGTFKVNLEDEEIEKVSVVLTKEQVEELMAKDATLSIENKGVMVELPISIFEEEGMSVLLEKLPAVNHAHSDVYDFTITQGDRVVSDFGEPVTLSFDVNLDGVEDPSKLKVFYLNEETGEWEKIGGSYENGVVTAQTYHFSRYTVFEESDIIVADQGEQSQEVVTSETPQPSDEKTETEGTTSEKTSDEASDKNRESAPTVATDSEATQSVKEADATGSRNDVNENNELPNTATNTGNILAMGILFAVAGIVLFFMRRKTRKEV